MNNIKIITRKNMNEEIEKIKSNSKNDIKIYSISRLNNINTCPKQYYYTYIQKLEQDLNPYSMLGNSVHLDVEQCILGETKNITPNNFNNEWLKTEIFGINFMNDKVKNNYKKDIDTFYSLYKKPKGNFITELGFILEVDPERYIIGYIDIIEILEDNKIKIYDIKTSSLFKGNKIKESGRQLTLYEMAMNQLYGLEVVENAWIMVKYLTVKISDNKPKIVSAREWVSKCKTQLKKLFKKEGIDDIMIEAMLIKCEQDNNIDILPENIKNQVEISTYVCDYEVTDEVKKECMEYILNTIEDIENRNEEDEMDWECNVNPFFCQNLCGFSKKHCKSWKNKR